MQNTLKTLARKYRSLILLLLLLATLPLAAVSAQRVGPRPSPWCHLNYDISAEQVYLTSYGAQFDDAEIFVRSNRTDPWVSIGTKPLGYNAYYFNDVDPFSAAEMRWNPYPQPPEVETCTVSSSP